MINGKYYQKNFGVENQVFFDGTLPGGQPVYDWLDDLDLYLIPSLQEGLPRALVEAMSRGCPAIGAKTGGIPELLGKDCIYGRKNYKKLAKKIKMILYNKSKTFPAFFEEKVTIRLFAAIIVIVL